tara:strand:+ start:4286 stop:6337 length:2052 start_codon:yes stop_codon:yes gene_type:complete
LAESSLKKLVRELKADVEDAFGDTDNPTSPTDAFTDQILQALTEEGRWPQHTITHFRHPKKRDLGEISAYGIDDDSRTLYLCVTEYDETNIDVKEISKRKVKTKLQNLSFFYEKAVAGTYQMDPDSENEAACRIIEEGIGHDYNSVKFFFLTNFEIPDDLAIELFDNVQVTHGCEAIGIQQIANLYNLGADQGPLDVDFVKLTGAGFPCLPATKTQQNVKIYSGFIPGESLGSVYSQYGPRLLELNVRSFLQATGKVNKGIRETIENNPEKFLSFNNGITVTASAVEIDDDSNVTALKNMQVVNGGQTTASLSRALNDGIDLGKIFVHMKIVEVPQTDVAKVVPEISRYANRQNAVSEADLTAHHPFHIAFEEIAEEVPVTATGARNSYWFYERMKGAYRNLLADAKSTNQREKLKGRFPKKQVFTKTDLAKYHNSWAQRPWLVARGATKNFTSFMVDLETGDDIPEKPDEEFFKLQVAKAILFRQTDKIVAKQKFGGWKAQIVCYTIAYISKRIKGQLNYESIWATQALSEEWVKAITVTCSSVHNHLTNPADGQNIGEYCKKEETWNEVKMIDIDFDYYKLISFDYVLPVDADPDETLTKEQTEALAWAKTITKKETESLAVWIVTEGAEYDRKLFGFGARGFVPEMVTRMEANLELYPKQATWLKNLWDGAREYGWDNNL